MTLRRALGDLRSRGEKDARKTWKKHVEEEIMTVGLSK